MKIKIHCFIGQAYVAFADSSRLFEPQFTNQTATSLKPNCNQFTHQTATSLPTKLQQVLHSNCNQATKPQLSARVPYTETLKCQHRKSRVPECQTLKHPS